MSAWFVNVDPKKKGDPHWLAYADKDADKIEKGFAKKQKTMMLNETYKIDFSLMRQVRRDDPDRWRIIKRGGAVTDAAPGDDKNDEEEDAKSAKDDEEEDEKKEKAKEKAEAKVKVVKAAPDAPWPIPADPPAAAAKDEEEEEAPAPKPALKKGASKNKAAAAEDAASSAASSGASSTALAHAEKQVESLKGQLADLENELDGAEGRAKTAQDEVTAKTKEIAALTKEVATLKQSVEAARKEKDTIVKERDAAVAKAKAAQAASSEVDELKKANEKLKTTASQAQSDLTAARAESKSLRSELAQAREDAAQVDALQAQLDESKQLYSVLIEAIKPIATAFGIQSSSPIAKAIAAFEKLQSTTGSAKSKSSAASSAAASKKRNREEEKEEEEAAERARESKKAKPAAAAPASPVSPAAAVSPISPTLAPASPTAMNIDDDATQPMLAPADHAGGAASSAAASSSSPASSNFLSQPDKLKSFDVKSMTRKTPSCFSKVPSKAFTPTFHMAVIGYKNRGFDVVKLDLASGESFSLPVRTDITKVAPAHAFGEGENEEDHGMKALAVLPLREHNNYTKFLLVTGEGRLLRLFTLSFTDTEPPKNQAVKKCYVAEFDVGSNGWVSVISDVCNAGQRYIAVGVSGANHTLQLYQLTENSDGSIKAKLDRTIPTVSEEVHSVGQLKDGRLVIAGCSAAINGALDESGSVELWKWDSVNPTKSRQFLKNDIKVRPDIGLRCNGLKVFSDPHDEDKEYLLAAYEYCSNGDRQLMLYPFDTNAKNSLETSAIIIEAKNSPSLEENSFTAIDVAPGTMKAAAMTYGGRIHFYDLQSRRKVFTCNAHPESNEDEGSKLMISQSLGSTESSILISSGGKDEIKVWRMK